MALSKKTKTVLKVITAILVLLLLRSRLPGFYMKHSRWLYNGADYSFDGWTSFNGGLKRPDGTFAKLTGLGTVGVYNSEDNTQLVYTVTKA